MADNQETTTDATAAEKPELVETQASKQKNSEQTEPATTPAPTPPAKPAAVAKAKVVTPSRKRKLAALRAQIDELAAELGVEDGDDESEAEGSEETAGAEVAKSFDAKTFGTIVAKSIADAMAPIAQRLEAIESERGASSVEEPAADPAPSAKDKGPFGGVFEGIF